MKRGAIVLASLASLGVNYLADRLTKLLALRYLTEGERLSFLGDTVVITLASNAGAFLSMGAQWPPALKYALLLVFPLIACAYGVYYILVKETKLTRAVLLGAVIGGGFGNLIDRLLNDFHVVDFLNFGIGRLRTGVLNVADLSVTFGAIALIVYEYAEDKRKGALSR
ncbi:MAG TPA: signal peptidase II [Spirochaetaceae bacterium]|jgi:signal peptidase II|nr:signal peptidase II [Spirochaetaceae bacterium]